MCRKRLDTRDRFPSGMEDYLSMYGWHFSKKMCEWAVSLMSHKEVPNGTSKIEMLDHDAVKEMLRRYGVELKSVIGYDADYVLHMAKADYYGSSIIDEQHLTLFVKDYLEDVDGYDEVAFTRFYADCIGKGEIIPWEDVI